jgi:uncharacterized protein YndB with AHSA1/START domain
MTNHGTVEITTPTPLETVVRRTFDAPRHLVFEALTQPDLLRRWYGPPGWSLVVCEVDLRVGGGFRFVSRRDTGKDVGQRGEYLEIAAPERLVNTERWEDWDAGDCRVTTVLDEREGRTTLTSTVLFPSQEVRDTVLKSGLEKSAGALYDKLAELLGTLAELPVPAAT